MDDFGRRCERFKTVMTKHGKQRRCAEFSGGDLGSFGDAAAPGSISGPLIGGGLTQVSTLAAKIIGRGKPWGDKYGAAIGLGVGGLVSGVLAFRQSSRHIGIPALITTALVALPRLAEDMLAPASGSTKGALGVITAEQELAGFGAEEMLGADAIQLLDAGGGVGFGVTTAEQEMGGAQDVSLLGDQNAVQMLGARPEAELFGAGAGFGSNFLSNQ